MEAEPASYFLSSLPSLFLWASNSTPELLMGILGILLLLICSALISGSEVAFFSLSPHDIFHLQQEDTPSATRILRMKDKPRSLLATILISNNFINVAITIVSFFLQKKFLPQTLFESWATQICNLLQLDPLQWNSVVSDIIGYIITIVGVTSLLVLFGEIAPKVYARFNNIQLARITSKPLSILMRLFQPFSFILVTWTVSIENRLSNTSRGGTLREDIDEAIELAVSQDDDRPEEVDILKSIVKFGEVSVKQIMRSRVDVVAVDFRISYTELIQIVRESGFSRIPVYDDDFDNVTGILYVKDLLGHLHEEASFEWQELIRTNIMYVPEAKKIDDLLKEFQQNRMHMAIVVDEYGGSSGIVTLEDILEEIIGDIKDEFDDDTEVLYKKIDDANYLFEGKTLLNDVCRVIGVDTNTFDDIKGEADSLAGLILELLGEIPRKDTTTSFETFKFKIVSVNKRRIEQVLVTIEEQPIHL
ncbi:MAG: gliding motility-associated protein GldE [Bacteroidota bacterium]